MTESATDDLEADVSQPDREPTVPGSSGTRRTVSFTAFALACVASLVLAAVALVAVLGGSNGGAGDDAAPRQAAGRFAELLFTFEYQSLDDWREALLASSTGGFATEFEKTESGLRAVIESSQLRGEAEAREVFISDVDRGAASVIVILDYRTIGPDGPTSVSDEPIRLELVRVDGRWLIADVKTVGGASPLGGLG